MFSSLKKIFKKKKLTLKEINQIYLLVEHALPEQDEVYLIDEVDKLVEGLKPGTMVQCLKIMYKKDLSKESDLKLFILFIRSLNENFFFDYVRFVKGIHGRHKRNRPN